MRTHLLGYPRIGEKRELKRACEKYWAGKIDNIELLNVSREICLNNWNLQKNAAIDFIPCNDFSFYDHVLDLTLSVGAIPKRFVPVALNRNNSEIDLYFAMARGYQKNDLDITALEMTKWFNTNYHYIVPEFIKDQEFSYFSNKILNEFLSAKAAGVKNPKPVLIGMVSYLLLGKEKEKGFNKLDLLNKLYPVYKEILADLVNNGMEIIQFDEPFLALDLEEDIKLKFVEVYKKIRKDFPNLKILLATYFDELFDNEDLVLSLPIDILHVDLTKENANQLDSILKKIPNNLHLSLGVIDGKNIWKNNFEESLKLINKAKKNIGEERLLISTSCSLLHTPCNLELENNNKNLTEEVKDWLAFAKQKLEEVSILSKLSSSINNEEYTSILEKNKSSINSRKTSLLINNRTVKNRILSIKEIDYNRKNSFKIRKPEQEKELQLPLFPTTTIGSFPQTPEVRSWRANYKKGIINSKEYTDLLKQETYRTIKCQESLGLDVLVHGEYERNDMVEYFGESLNGFTFTNFGWVQSYGSRCVKPPIIYGDVYRKEAMTVFWSKYAQSVSNKIVKGMLTGPVTILQWSFVRDDQPRELTCKEIALAIKDEVIDLEEAGIKIIQIDEPAIREGLPLRKHKKQDYLKWAVRAFKLSSSAVKDSTQIHTHMCYSEFNDIISDIADLDADVITIECSRSQMELLDAFHNFNYPNDIGPGVYDIHSPRVPSKEEITNLMEKAIQVIPINQLWINPDCGLKTRHWEETEKALEEMVASAEVLRKKYS